jgi:hypothetical protein
MKYFVNKMYLPMFNITKNSCTCLLCTRECFKPGQHRSTTENNIRQHIASKLHLNNIELLKIQSTSSNHQNIQQQKAVPPLVNVPKTIDSPIFTALSVNESDLLGTEYIFKFIDCSKCFLCNTPVNLITLIDHLQSNIHQEKYLNFHFPSIFKFINDIEQRVIQSNLTYIEPKMIKLALIRKVCAAVRDHCGVLLPKLLEVTMAQADHDRIVQSIATENHFNEKDHPQIKDMMTDEYVKSMILEGVRRIFPDSQKPSADEQQASEPKEPKICADNDEDRKELNDTDFQVLLDNFDSLKPQEQQRLVAHIKTFSPENFDNLKKILTDKGAGHLQEALMRS